MPLDFGEIWRKHLESYRLPRKEKVVGGPSYFQILRTITFTSWMMFFCEPLISLSLSLSLDNLPLQFARLTTCMRFRLGGWLGTFSLFILRIRERLRDRDPLCPVIVFLALDS